MSILPNSSRMLDRGQIEGSHAIPDPVNRKTVFLYAGQIFVSQTPTVVRTILGSCVSVCLWEHTRKIGGINHYSLPYRFKDHKHSMRFGCVANEELLNRLLEAGGLNDNIVAKVFGGAHINFKTKHESGLPHLGRQNITLAFCFLERHQIPVLESDFDGERGRKLIFRTDTGQTAIKLLEE